jgi:hypothetical protein
MVFMHSEDKAALIDILDIVLVQGDNSSLKSALSEKEVNGIFALCTVSPN